MKKLAVIAFLSLAVLASSCDDGKLNFFTVEQDIEFGMQLDSTVLANPTEYPVLSRTGNVVAYEHLDRILSILLTATDLRYPQKFPWKVTIIKNDEVLNAFAAPGGYMYFYTGLIKFLDNEAQFAGVMAHEMAHADRRHSTEMLTKQYGFGVLAGLILGDNPNMLTQIIAELAMGLGNLQYSRDNEYEADEYGVKYLYGTEYHARELAGFFEKMNELANSPRPPEFLSTHPSPENRIEKILETWTNLGGKQGKLFVERYQEFKNSLPAN